MSSLTCDRDCAVDAPAVAATAKPAVDKAVWLRRVEIALAVLLSSVAALLHVRFISNVGALWRDEANSVNLANLSSLREAWQFLDYDSFPMLFFAVLRGWTAVFGPENDTALRAFGLLVGLGIIGALWWNAHSLGARLPVLSLALVGLNPMIIRYGDSIRAYGLGMLLILLAFRSFWRLVDPEAKLTTGRIVSATCWAVLSVQCLYYNAVLLLAICAGASVVALRAGMWRRIALVISIGAVAAVSLLPYVPMMRRMKDWTFLVSYPADFAWIWTRLCDVIGSPDPIGVWIWSGLFLAGVIIALRWKAPAPVLFAGVALIVGAAAYAIFLNVLNYHTQPWYYITLVAFAACALDVVFGAWRPAFLLHGLRVGAAVLLLALSGYGAWESAPIRHTNVDQLAAQLEPITSEGDVILVPRWECAIPMARYYRGPAEIITLPPIEDRRFHRYDLIVAQMKLPLADVVQPVLAKIEHALRSGHRVYIAGTLPYPTANVAAPTLPPMYRDPESTWQGTSYTAEWEFITGQFLRAHATHGKFNIFPPATARVQGYEKLEVSVAAGWR